MIKLKESYDTLMKFSFLAQDDDQIANEVTLGESKEKLKHLYFSTKKSNLVNTQIGNYDIDVNDLSNTV